MSGPFNPDTQQPLLAETPADGGDAMQARSLVDVVVDVMREGKQAAPEPRVRQGQLSEALNAVFRGQLTHVREAIEAERMDDATIHSVLTNLVSQGHQRDRELLQALVPIAQGSALYNAIKDSQKGCRYWRHPNAWTLVALSTATAIGLFYTGTWLSGKVENQNIGFIFDWGISFAIQVVARSFYKGLCEVFSHCSNQRLLNRAGVLNQVAVKRKYNRAVIANTIISALVRRINIDEQIGQETLVKVKGIAPQAVRDFHTRQWLEEKADEVPAYWMIAFTTAVRFVGTTDHMDMFPKAAIVAGMTLAIAFIWEQPNWFKVAADKLANGVSWLLKCPSKTVRCCQSRNSTPMSGYGYLQTPTHRHTPSAEIARAFNDTPALAGFVSPVLPSL